MTSCVMGSITPTQLHPRSRHPRRRESEGFECPIAYSIQWLKAENKVLKMQKNRLLKAINSKARKITNMFWLPVRSWTQHQDLPILVPDHLALALRTLHSSIRYIHTYTCVCIYTCMCVCIIIKYTQICMQSHTHISFTIFFFILGTWRQEMGLKSRCWLRESDNLLLHGYRVSIWGCETIINGDDECTAWWSNQCN